MFPPTHSIFKTPDFASCSLEGSDLSRGSRVPEAYRPEAYEEAFDADTLWVDAIYQNGRVVLVCPRLNNLLDELLTGTFRLDGKVVTPRIRQFNRHSIVTLAARTRPGRVSVEIGDWRGESQVNATQPDVFRGSNVIVTLSKDNALEWIHDFARFHVHHHGANAILFVDNGSSGYQPPDIERALKTAGLETCLVLSTTLKYGPRGRRPYLHPDQYLQTCIMNIARLRYLSHARAVLNCDVDELVCSKGRSVFDLAARSPLGFVRFAGSWRYPAADHVGPARHGDHEFQRKRPKTCSEKWCIVPGGPLRNFQWRPHTLERLPFPKLFNTGHAAFWHCRSVTRDWKGYGRLAPADDTVPDTSISSAMHAAGIV